MHPENQAVLGELGDIGTVDREPVRLAVLGCVLAAPKEPLKGARQGSSNVSVCRVLGVEHKVHGLLESLRRNPPPELLGDAAEDTLHAFNHLRNAFEFHPAGELDSVLAKVPSLHRAEVFRRGVRSNAAI